MNTTYHPHYYVPSLVIPICSRMKMFDFILFKLIYQGTYQELGFMRAFIKMKARMEEAALLWPN